MAWRESPISTASGRYFLEGTLAPLFLAFDSPMAMACLRFLTFRPERPLLSLPRLYSCIAVLTCFFELPPYLAMTLCPFFRRRLPSKVMMYQLKDLRTKCRKDSKKGGAIKKCTPSNESVYPVVRQPELSVSQKRQ